MSKYVKRYDITLGPNKYYGNSVELRMRTYRHRRRRRRDNTCLSVCLSVFPCLFTFAPLIIRYTRLWNTYGSGGLVKKYIIVIVVIIAIIHSEIIKKIKKTVGSGGTRFFPGP